MHHKKNLNRAGSFAALCAIFFLVLAAGCAKKTVPAMDVSFLPCSGDFVSSSGDRLSPDQVVALAEKADYLLIGEGHKMSCDHKIQAEMVDRLSRNGRRISIGLEMVDTTFQDTLNRYNLGQIPLDKIAAALKWDKNWGYDFSLFEPVFRLAEERHLTLGALNFPFSLVRKIREKGLDGLSPEERAMLPEKVQMSSKEQQQALLGIIAMHENRDADNLEQVHQFILIQSLWDTAMAEKAVELRRQAGTPVIILAGDGHVENGWGISKRIKTFDPQARIMLLVPWRGDKFYSKAGDAFFYCPPAYKSRLGMKVEMRFGKAVVTKVDRGSRADLAGMRPGDVICEVQSVPMVSMRSMHLGGMKAHKENKPLVFKVERGDDTFDINVGKLGHPGSSADK
jgi:uncharacterized iron-regulated protein